MKTALALFLLALPARAATLACRADYDEGSHYELEARVGARGIEGNVAFRYVTDDGHDLLAALEPRSQSIAPGGKIALAAANDAMDVTLDAAFASPAYRGTLRIAFSLEHAEPLLLDTTCSLR